MRYTGRIGPSQEPHGHRHNPAGANPPHEINVVIEIPQGGLPVKYEIDKVSGALMMVDDAGDDEKIIAVPVDKLHPFYRNVARHLDLPEILREQIAHFFQHSKDLEKGKWVTIAKWVGPEEAKKLIADGIERAKGKSESESIQV